MLQTTNRIHQHIATLRCVWVPSHTGPNAPLTAVWIESLRGTPFKQEKQASPVMEEDSWLCAA
ncbi:hypothetical protein [Edaphobacter dinghuensis]|uniref:Uncharacterized protein n=1 Tax=Edaphobacter dinghuensis TaxID=1560005 RepID=A0A917MA79_9BACT|nr:hypothetical protein [Edaphobacter dinghuensis]GGG84828.1 hypothetical protein GCM10011585_30780 [Edaphobacter dinghuensis]